MKKSFETPNFEFVRFEDDDIVTTSSSCSCNVGGIEFDEDDDVCPSGDAECTCTDEQKNCA